MPWTSDHPRRTLSISYHPAYLSGNMDQQTFGSHDEVDRGWAAGGAQEALLAAITRTGPWWSSVAPGVADGRTASGVPGTRGYRDGGRPDISALLEAATKEQQEQKDSQAGAGKAAPVARL